jgi:LPS-assembly protein
MRLRTLGIITALALCHLQLDGQALTNSAPPLSAPPQAELPEDPGQELLPVAEPEPEPPTGVPVDWEARSWGHASQTNTWTLDGDVVFHYRGYTVQADKVIYRQATGDVECEGHLRLTGGEENIVLTASRGQINLRMHTARFYDVKGTLGVLHAGRDTVYSTTNPFQFSGRLLLETGKGHYRIVDGKMTNCRLPRPDWQLIAHSIRLDDGQASTSNTVFKLFGVPLFYLPYLRHPASDTGRQSGLLIPVVSMGSSVRGFTLGEQVYVVLNRSMDMIIGSEYYSERGWAPNGDFRYKGPGQDYLNARWNAVLDRGTRIKGEVVNQGGVDVSVQGRADLGPNTRLAANVDYLSNYTYRLVFNDNYKQAVSSQVASQISLTHNHNGMVLSGAAERFQSFAKSGEDDSKEGDEVRILHLPGLRFDVLDRQLAGSPAYFGLGSSLGYLSRSELDMHARNVGRMDIYPHLSLPIMAGGWSIVPEAALRGTFYSVSQNQDLTGERSGTPSLNHRSLLRNDAEASLDVRAPALVRDFSLARWNRTLRHVIEPEIGWRFVGGIGSEAQRVLLLDTTDIATNTNEAGYSLTQRFYLKPTHPEPCEKTGDEKSADCNQAREWASWQIAQKFYLDLDFGGAILTGRRNVFDSTLDLSGVSFLVTRRNMSPVISRLRFEAVRNLRVEWDLDYDPKFGRLSADNLYAGYSWGRTTVGVGHALLNAVDQQGTKATTLQSQQLQPFFEIGKQSGRGFNLAANGSYDFVLHTMQYAGVQAVYNWDCCGLTVGYRRFTLGQLRDETQYLYSFTLANFGSVGDIRRSNRIFRDPTLPPPY